MLQYSNRKANAPKAEELTNALNNAVTDAETLLPDKEIILKELDSYRIAQIYKQLPDHCIQLFFLS